jgi:D-alanyl-lipoteichoic acid acyltransferase DltB (MBOAT superfamily)
MLFNSLDFAVFFAVLYGLYLLLPHRGQNILLLAGSYFFYALWDWRFLGLIALCTVVDFGIAGRISRTEDERSRKRLLLASLAVNLGVLGFFKYFGCFAAGAMRLLNAAGLHVPEWQLQIALPVGISFYVFKTMSYVLDVHGRQMPAEKSLLNYAVHVSFFPYLLSGPIDRARTFLPQLASGRAVDAAHVREGLWLFLWGLFKKMVVADNIASIAGRVMQHHDASMPWAQALLGVYAYAVQLYCDFSGYTDMARGVVTLLGFTAPPNFRNPFFAHDPVEFWKRWHISLSKWVQDYVYFPMAASLLRRGSGLFNQYIPHIVTMVAIGLWHGANWNYAIYGVYWGVVIVAYYEIRRWAAVARKKAGRRPEKTPKQLPWTWRRGLKAAGMFHITCGGMVLFATATLSDAACVFRSIFAGGVLAGVASRLFLNNLLLLVLLGLPVLILEIIQEVRGDEFAALRLSPVPQVALFASVAILLVTVGNTGGGVFVYMQF